MLENKAANSLLYLYDLPKDSVTSVKIANVLKLKANYESSDPIQIKRDLNKNFYSAIIKVSGDKANF
jgi:hypothetical protein